MSTISKHVNSRAASANVTGRDGYIIAQALVRFVATEALKPHKNQQWSNLNDARAILNARCPKAAWIFCDEYDHPVGLVDEKAPRHLTVLSK